MERVQSSTRSASDQFVPGGIFTRKLRRRDALRLGVIASVAGILSEGVELTFRRSSQAVPALCGSSTRHTWT